MSLWSSKFKERMLQLRLAIRDYETKEVYLGNFGEIHDHVISRMNDKRMERGLLPHDWSSAFHKGRGYIRKDTKEFMMMTDAVAWASATGYDNDRWCGESIALRGKQEDMGGKKYY